jgi:hypothetical protein
VHDHVKRLARSSLVQVAGDPFELLRRQVLLARHASESVRSDRDPIRLSQYDVKVRRQLCEKAQRLEHRQRLAEEIMIAILDDDVDLLQKQLDDEFEDEVSFFFGQILTIDDVAGQDQNVQLVFRLADLEDYSVEHLSTSDKLIRHESVSSDMKVCGVKEGHGILASLRKYGFVIVRV